MAGWKAGYFRFLSECPNGDEDEVKKWEQSRRNETAGEFQKNNQLEGFSAAGGNTLLCCCNTILRDQYSTYLENTIFTIFTIQHRDVKKGMSTVI